MKSFSEFLSESTKEITFTFGRFNPPTIGHEKLLNAVQAVAGGGKYAIYASQTSDAKKNPLTYEQKIKFMRKMFPRHARSILIDTNVKTALDVLIKLYDQGYTKVNFVVGSDRVAEFTALMSKYNGVKTRNGFYHFNGGVNIISAGERDPDADDVTGMSASKMRAAATANDMTLFSKGLPHGFKEVQQLFADVRAGMGLKEEHTNHIELKTVSEIREQYVKGELFNVGDPVVIKESDEIGSILVCGSNYVIVESSDGKKLRKWLEDVEPLAEDKGSYQHHLFQKNPKHALYHAKHHFDKDNDGDIDELDKTTPDELTGTEHPEKTLLMFKKYAKEKQHTRVGRAFESKGKTNEKTI